MHRVSDVLAPDFARSWHEAVAIVQEVASQLVPGGTVPGAEDLLFESDGTIQLGFGPDSPQNAVQALGGLLLALLDGVDAPVGLRDLAAGNSVATPTHTSIDSFKRALAFYERPVRTNDLQAVASRLRAAPVQSPEAAFEQLRERVAAKAQAEPVVETVEAKKPKGRNPRQAAIVTAVAALAALFAIVVYARPRYLGAGVADQAEQKLADTISTGLNKLGAIDGQASGAPALAEAPDAATVLPAPNPAGAKGLPTVGTTFQKGRPGGAVTQKPAPALPVKGQLPATVAQGAGTNYGDLPAATPTPAPVTPAPGHLEDGLVTFTAADIEVQPPRLSRQQLPRQPEPGDDTGYFDVTVNESGDVDHIQLISPMRRFQERMLIAAAKAWKFKPALKDGQPVRYRIRIAIILSDKP